MNTIRKLTSDEMDIFIDIAANAYPVLKINSEQDKEKIIKRLIRSEEKSFSIGVYGLFCDDKLIGGMRLFEFTMNMLSTQITLGGIGFIAVHQLHKKEKVCREMIRYFINRNFDKNTSILALYSFKLDFYKKMGFGFGNKTSQYRIQPDQISVAAKKDNINFIPKTDKGLLKDCYHRIQRQQHGLIKKSDFEVSELFRAEENKKIGYYQNGRIEGYLVFQFQLLKGFTHNLKIIELFYENREALAQILAFLRSQSDQVNEIILDTQDDYIHFLMDNPVNDKENVIQLHHATNVEELGLMYRIINVKKIFTQLADRNFGGVNCNLKLNLQDNFHKPTNGVFFLSFKNGKVNLDNVYNFDVEITLDIANFTSLVMGLITFSKLYEYGLADISNPAPIPIIDRIFYVSEKPKCVTKF